MMSSEIERLDNKRILLLKWHLAGILIFLVFSTVRFFFRAGKLNTTPIGLAVLAFSILGVVVSGLSTAGLAAINHKVKQEPSLQEALSNEYIRAIELRSWRAAFIGSVVNNIFFVVIYFIYPVYDPVLVALNSIIIGAGAYHLSFYLKYKSS
jgi:hypothetical protein